MRTDGLPSSHLDGALYGADGSARKLVVIVDFDTVNPDPEQVDTQGLLGGLLPEDTVQWFRYSDAGAPSDTQRFGGDWLPDHPVGWVAVSDDESDLKTRTVSVADEATVRQTAVFTEMVMVGAQALSNGSTAPAQAHRDALLVAASESIGADILVTAREPILSSENRFAYGATVASPSQALPLIGLYLRARGEFIRSRGDRVKFNSTKSGFYEAAVLHFAPRFLDVVRHIGAVEGAGAREGVYGNGVSAFRRARRSFERRDRLWMLSNQAHDRGVAEDILGEFEVLLTTLVGVLDPLAKVTDELFELGTQNPQWIGWQKPKWRAAVKDADPVLGAIFSGGSEAWQVLTVLTELRNLIHAEGLDVASFGDGRRNQRTWFTIAPGTVATIIERTGGINIAALWGFMVTTAGYWLAEPGPLSDLLITGVMKAVDQISRQFEPVLRHLATASPAPQLSYNVELIDRHVGWLLGMDEADEPVTPGASS
ncbi:hypothetical protein AXZ95_2373 [Leifsonia sp. 115AMFTsu3.1]|nr:hypothetical protein AXZ95_2373 [Leifsonia sp. 115AMFTsu3.1]